MAHTEKILHLPTKAKWYNMIESGEKPEEYRDFKPYWYCRLVKNVNKLQIGTHLFLSRNLKTKYLNTCIDFVDYKYVEFSYGYTKRRMIKEIERISIGYGRPEWGAEPNKICFVIKLKQSMK